MTSTVPNVMTERAIVTEPLFYCAALNDDDIVLTGDEARHVAVQRLRAGDAIAVFDGCGQVARGGIQAISRNAVRVTVEERWREPRSAPDLELYSALPKGDRAAVLLDMATQLGMARFTPVRWHRSVAIAGERSQERWHRICLEACKQSRRLYVPEIAPPVAAEAAAAAVRERGDYLFVAHPGMDARPALSLDLDGAGRIALFVGPEGGLTEDEVAALRGLNVRFVHLGRAILRIETAAVALLAVTNALLATTTVRKR